MRRKTDKIVLTERQEKWLKNHYKNTKNEKICERLGISLSAMHRIVRELGLKKSKQFMRTTQAAAVEAALVAMDNETEEQKERRRQQARQNATVKFKPGVYPHAGKTAEELAEMQRKRLKTWKARRAADEVRLNWGYPQETNLRFRRHPDREKNQQLIYLRWYMRTKGYEIPGRSGMAAHITEATRRSAKCEATARRLGMVIREI